MDLDKPTEDQKQKMLETTLSMSTYDFSLLDTTGLKQAKSSLMVTAKDVPFRLETSKTVVIKRAQLAVKDENDQMKCDKSVEEAHIDENQERDPKEHMIVKILRSYFQKRLNK